MAYQDVKIPWEGWHVINMIGKGGFGTVYEIERSQYGIQERAAMKVISIPQSADEIDDLLIGGYDNNSITQRFDTFAEDIVREYGMMAQMKGNANIVYCDDYRIIQQDNGFGRDIYIRMELLTPLLKAMDRVSSESQIIRFGMEMCNALEACQKRKVIHRDIKPQNIFVSDDGVFKLGDFGIARKAEKTTRATVGKGTYQFMAPEVKNELPYGQTVDIYSLGLVMYWLLNNRRGPFFPLPPAVPTYSEEKEALGRRFAGEHIPAPQNGSEELKRIVLKACAFDPEDRYQSAREMREELAHLSSGYAEVVNHEHKQTQNDDNIEERTVGPVFSKSSGAEKEMEDKTVGPVFNQETDSNKEKTAGPVFKQDIVGDEEKTVGPVFNKDSSNNLDRTVGPDFSSSTKQEVIQKKQGSIFKTVATIALIICCLLCFFAFFDSNTENEGVQSSSIQNSTDENLTNATYDMITETDKISDELAILENNNDIIRVGIATPDVTHGWVAGVAYYAEKYCQDNGLEYKVHTSADAAEMQAGLQDLVAWGATVIVSFPQWAGMETAMQEIIDAGIPVVNFDVDVACEGIYKVTGDNYDMGYQSAKYIVEKAGEAATIIVMDVPSSGSVCELRKQGFYDYLTEIGYDQSNIVEYQLESFARDDGLTTMADILEAHPHIDAVYSMDDETSIGSIQAMKEAGRTEIKAITGGGGCQEYFKIIESEEGKAIGAASVLYSPAMIQDAIKVAIKLMNGEEVEPVIFIPATIVSAVNVADHLDPSNNVY